MIQSNLKERTAAAFSLSPIGRESNGRFIAGQFKLVAIRQFLNPPDARSQCGD